MTEQGISRCVATFTLCFILALTGIDLWRQDLGQAATRVSAFILGIGYLRFRQQGEDK